MSPRPEFDASRDDGVAREAALVVRQTRRRLLRRSLGMAPVVMTIASGPAIAGNKVFTASAQCSAATSGPTRGAYDCNGKTHVSWCRDGHSTTNDDANADWSNSENCYVSRGRKTSGHGWPMTCDTKTKHHGGSRPQVWTSCAEGWSTSANHYEVMNRHCSRSGVKVDEYWDKVEHPRQQTEEWKQKNPNCPARSNSASTLKLAAHCSAAFLNCESGRVPAEICDADRIREIWDACKSGGTWTPTGSNCQQSWKVDDVCRWFTSMCSET